MDAQSWSNEFGKLARETMVSPELERYFSIPINKRRAQVILQQLSLYVRHRRDCWAFVSGNTPVLAIKQKILGHEYEEMIRDQHSEHGHLGNALCLGLDVQKETLARRPVGYVDDRMESRRPSARRHRRRSRLSHGPALGRAVGDHLGRFAELESAP